MFKFFVLGVILWLQVVQDVFGQTKPEVPDTPPPVLSTLIPPFKNETSKELTEEKDGKYNFHATQQIIYLGAFPPHRLNGFTNVLGDAGRELPPDYIATQGIGAHKLHSGRVKWNNARRKCIEEGGHLAIIRSNLEETILRQMLIDNSLLDAWVGYHDNFEEGEWITVLDEPILQVGWGRWSKRFANNPDNYKGNENCAQLLSIGGIDDFNCHATKSFFCKINL